MANIAQMYAVALQCHQAGNLGQAEQLYQLILAENPSHVDAHCGLGMVLASRAKVDEAMGHYRQALAVNPRCAEAYNNLGNIYLRQGKTYEAAAHYFEALKLRPDYAEVHCNLGIALQSLGRVEEAEAHARQALAIRPDYPEAHHVLANALFRQCHLEEAMLHWREVIRLKPAFPMAHNNLGYVLLRQGQHDMALASFREALRLQPDLAAAQTNVLSCLNYLPQADPDAIFEEHRRWGQLVESAHQPFRHANIPFPERRLRIGYVSADLRHHAVARYLEPVLAHHDPRQVEVFCYADVQSPDAVTARLQGLANAWRWICGLTDSQVAERIRGDSIDILVDLAGHTNNSRLRVFAQKPAPVQATWLGYMNTTGLTTMDYRLTDDVLDPQVMCEVRSARFDVERISSNIEHRTSHSSQYDTEELMRLPGGMCCFGPPLDAPPVTPPPALHRGHLTFGSTHGLLKLNGWLFDLWTEVLKAVPEARLLLFRDTLTKSVQDRIRRQFGERGIVGERLDMRQGLDLASFLAVYAEIDVTLDAFPCTGGVTTCEALWMGVPVVSLCGVRPASRNSAAILTRAGLADWVVQTPQEYVALGVKWANAFDGLARLRAQLRGRMAATLCDAVGFTRGLEDAYRTMWRRWCVKQEKVRGEHG